MTRSLLFLTLATSAVLARHAHARPGHEHMLPRQLGTVAGGSLQAAPVPVNAGSVPAAAAAVPATPNGAGGLAQAPAGPGALTGAAGSVPAAGVPNAAALPGTGAAGGAVPVIATPSAAVPVVATPSVAVPVAPGLPTSSVPSLDSITSLTSDLDSCLARIPTEVIAIVQAVEARLGAVQSQLANLGNLVSSALPSVSTPAVPVLSTPAIVPPAISTPTVPVIPTPTLPVVSTPGVPSVAAPTVPSIVTPALPSIATPALPSVATPSLPATPSVSVPGASAPAVPSVSLPTVATPSVLSAPTVSTPALPSVAVPTPTLPSVSTPTVAVPTTPTIPTGVPAVNAPTAASLPVSAPAASVAASSIVASAIFVSQNPSLCSPPNGLGPMVPCSSIQTSVPAAGGLASSVSILSPKFTFAPTALVAAGLNVVPNPYSITFTTITDFLPSAKPTVSTTPSSQRQKIFNANARDNLAAYYGSTPSVHAGGLAQLCSQNIDIVIVSFLYDFFSANGYPSIDFGSSSCSGMTAAQASTAPGLKNCSILASQIQTCQSLGKKVLLSLGGYVANSSFTSDLEARNFALTLWDLFGAGTGQASALRPFGNIVVDGFDLDNENGQTAHWSVFAASLRALFNSDISRTYYLSAAPQCIYPDASIPMYALQHADFVWVQFYNNPSCNLDSDGFQASFRKWSNALKNSSLPYNPRLYIGAPASAAGGSGYVTSSGLSSRISLARELFVSNFGGIMLWDGSTAMQNLDKSYNNYLQYAKWALDY